MKKTLTLLFGVLLCQLTFAAHITSEEAQQKALQFLNSRNASAHQGMRLAARGSLLNAASSTASYYVFNVGEQEGFVVVSGSDLAPAILGYADGGTFDETAIPDNMRSWLQGYDEQLRYLEAHKNATVVKAAAEEHAAISPLLTSQWGQAEPYNNLCPEKGSLFKTVKKW